MPESLEDQLRGVSFEEELKSTSDEIVNSCPNFRILLVGRSGVGKSALINAVFGSDVVREERGIKAGVVSDINKEIILPHNPRIVLHDSQGFSHGDGKNFETVINFIQKRSNEPELKDKLHVIWLCVEIPVYGGSLLEISEEKILQQENLNVPIVIVFTKFDKLVNVVRRSLPNDMADRDSVAIKQAKENFYSTYSTSVKKIREAKVPFIEVSVRRRYEQTRSTLIELTEKRITGTLWFIWASAQRPNVDLKIQASINIGRKKYWTGLSTSLNLPGRSLAKWLNVVHKDVVYCWGFYDPQKLLESKLFKNKMSELQNDLVEEGAPVLPISFGVFTTAAGVISGLVPPAAPFAVPIAAGVVFAGWVYNAYRTTPQVLRGMMGYIVDLTIVMQSLFWLTRRRAQALSEGERGTTIATVALSKRLVELAFEAYATDGHYRMVHERIQSFVRPTIALQPEIVVEKIVDLINATRFQPSENFEALARDVGERSEEETDWNSGL